MVLVRLGDDRRVKKIMRELKWSGSGLSVIVLESENVKQRETASEESKAKEKEPDRSRKKRCIQGESLAKWLGERVKDRVRVWVRVGLGPGNGLLFFFPSPFFFVFFLS